MIKFIKLTEANGNILIVNTTQIEHFTLGAKGKDIFIKMIKNGDKENCFFVQESIDTIWSMINTDTSKAPVIMTAEEALIYYKFKDST